MSALLEVEELCTWFRSGSSIARAVDGVSFRLTAGEVLAIVGESGCGKSVTSLSIMRLIPAPPGEIAGGHVKFHGRDLLTLSEAEMRDVRGNQISMIFQEPMSSLNPLLPVGEQIAEVMRLHQGLGRKAARRHAVEMLARVNIPEPERRADDYPHRLSGGMRQRVMIAMALSCRPDLLIADEPTTALDVTIQAQILRLIRDLRAEMGMGVLFITHNLGVVAQIADRVAVMYAGRIVEQGDVGTVFAAPMHPYTRALMRSIPRVGDRRDRRLQSISGVVPGPMSLPPGCSFAPRCPLAADTCRLEMPPLAKVSPGHEVRCFKWNETT
jgi:oligopeptide/dipeptide ABC transporter ATP-binding protein